MSRTRRLVDEIHDRSLWQIAGVYLGFAWIALQVTDHFVTNYLLPEWVYHTSLLLLVGGLPLVVATAIVERGVRRLLNRSSERVDAETTGWRRLLSWPRTLVTLTAAFLLLGVAAMSFALSRALGIGPAAPLIARGALGEGAVLVLADAENHTGDASLGSAMTEALRVDLSQSGAVSLLPPVRVRESLRRMTVGPDTPLDASRAREVAVREGAEAVVVGTVGTLGSGYVLTVRILRADTGEDLAAHRETASDADRIIEALDRLSGYLRARIGESVAGIQASQPLPTVTTSSLEALKLYARGVELAALGRQRDAIPFAEQAVALDTAFALAYRSLAVFHGNLGSSDASQRYAALAYRFARRLPEDERLLASAAHYAYRGYTDTAAYYYELLLERDPRSSVAANNLGDALEYLGSYADALRMYVLARDLNPNDAVPYFNIASVARTLGDDTLSEQMLTTLRERFPDAPMTGDAGIRNAFYAGDLEGVEALALSWAEDETADGRAASRYWRALAAATRGRERLAFSLADTAAQLYEAAGAPSHALTSIEVLGLAAWTAGEAAWAMPYLRATVKRAEGASPPLAHGFLGSAAMGFALADSMTMARSLLSRLDSIESTPGFHFSGTRHLVEAVMALSQRRPDAALDDLELARAANFGWRSRFNSYLLAEARAARGDLRGAVEAYRELTGTRFLNARDTHLHGALRPLAHERLGGLYLSLGDTAAAVEQLRAFTEMWRDADPALRPRVERARTRLAALER
jgi:tetratricopeptide (TPR) repeat protein